MGAWDAFVRAHPQGSFFHLSPWQGVIERAFRHKTHFALAEQDGAPVVPRQAVYALPGGTLDAQLAGRLPTLLAQGLLIDHVALTGAAPFERRPLPIAAALEEAVRLAGMVDALQPLPSLEVEGPPARS